MTALPTTADLTNFAATSGTMKTTHGNLRAFLAGLLGTTGLVSDALAQLGPVGAGYIAQSSAYTVTVADRGRLIDATGTWTLGLPAAATAGAGFAIALRNAGTGTITVDPASSEQIDGATTWAIGPGRSGLIVCTGSAWVTVGQLGSAVTTSTADATTGRLLRAGDLGLGVEASPLLADFQQATGPGGFFRTAFDATNLPAGFPSSAGYGVLLRNSAQSGTNVFGRLITSVNRNDAGVWFQKYQSSLWGPAFRLYNTGNLLGTVSQSGGTPTGAVLQGNASASSPTGGYFEQRANGFQECHHVLTTSDSAGTTWTYNTAFLDGSVPVVQATLVGTTALTVMLDAAPTATSAVVSVRNTSGARVAATVHLYARGRWSNLT